MKRNLVKQNWLQAKKGQLLVELLVAMGIFAAVVSVITFLILDTYLADRVGKEKMLAALLAREGIEVAVSIRDNNWQDLTNGEHGLKISGNSWIFQGIQEDISNQLRDGIRKIIIQEIDSDRKKIISQISWKTTETRMQDFTLVTYLTNWQKPGPPYVTQGRNRWRNDDGGE